MKTKYGNALKNNDGYYVISSTKEGNHKKLLHRLIFEDYHDCKLDENDVIHHIDEDKTNNHHTNLTCMSKCAHRIIHNTCKTHSEKTKIKISEPRNTSGYLNVCKMKNNNLKQGFTWYYRYYDDNGKIKSISCVDIEKLEEKVKAKGLKWTKIIKGGENNYD